MWAILGRLVTTGGEGECMKKDAQIFWETFVCVCGDLVVLSVLSSSYASDLKQAL
jgi:hypothetical protein